MAEHNDLVALLPAHETSIRVNADAAFRKTLLLSAASYFETRMSKSIIDIFSEFTNNSEALVEFVNAKAIERRYHDWFDWDARNANRFFRSFGSGFQSFMAGKVKEATDLEQAIRAFIEIGNLRNQLVHKNFALFPLDKTVSEIYDMYQEALGFVDVFLASLREFLRSDHFSPARE